MLIKPVLLWTDILLFALFAVIALSIIMSCRKAQGRVMWQKLLSNRMSLVSGIVLCCFILIGLMDSMHYQVALPNSHNGQTHYSPIANSVLDAALAPMGQQLEKTYSAPFALNLYVKESIVDQAGQKIRGYPRLKFAGHGIQSLHQRNINIIKCIGLAIIVALALWSILLLLMYKLHWPLKRTYKHYEINQRVLWLTVLCVFIFLAILFYLSRHYHVFGTSKIGQDVLYLTLKSIRTGLVIGTLTTLVTLPFALVLGMAAGYFGGVVDDIIQYIYTTLSSIPGVLLIAAAVLSLQVFITNHPEWFANLNQRADARLLALCCILGLTSWTGLCRLLRAETLKLREMEFVQAAKTLGTSKWRIMQKHILPNVMHIVLIAIVLDFSTLVLAEAVLSYVGVGVDPTTISWGNMINSARLQLAREPIVWWPLVAAFIFMFLLVLCANLFADGVRDALDPRT